ncbi:DNA repair protein RecN [Aquiluna sp.]|nr:DNA repair protein RecN [Aquiluna sp.]
MITSLGIKNIGVISSANLEFGAGFTALTGETGAGKTMVLTALGLLLGSRADSSTVRTGSQQLLVEGRISNSSIVLSERLSELGCDTSEEEILINRTVSSDGRSRAAIGGASVPVSVLEEITSELVTIHGQSDQTRLRSIARQREALDLFGGDAINIAKADYQTSFRQYQELQSRIARMQSASEADQLRLESLKLKISDIEALGSALGELSEVSEQINRMSNVESLRAAATSAHNTLSSEDDSDATELLSKATKYLDGSVDPELKKLAGQLSDITSMASEVSGNLASYLADLDADPKALDQLLGRKAELIAVERRYGVELDELITMLPALQAEVLDLDSSDEQIEQLEMQFAALESQLAAQAATLTKVRQEAAKLMSERVSEELAQLAMASARLEVQITPANSFEAEGADRVEFMLASYSGSEARSLSKGASGGELSRIMLAIELVLVAGQFLPTMIFDEVDAGVGGQAAVELGRRLKKLSESTQVIVVTHLPQVAAFADHQIRVAKDSSGEITESSVESLSQEQRQHELARMLSGNPDSEVALEHAKELLNSTN